jgi:hypothetical protein
MYFKQHLFILLFVCTLLTTNAQTNIAKNAFQKQDIALLDILFKDTVHSLHLQLNSSIYNFGIDKKQFRHFALVKNKKQFWLQPLASGQLFTIHKTQKGYALQRIDSTIHSGVNSSSFTFMFHDTLFQYGGAGFWNVRGIITYFSPETHEWELYPSHQLLNGYDSFENYVVYHLDTSQQKIYTTGYVQFKNAPYDLNINVVDSCFEFNFNNQSWKNLGATNPKLVKLFDKSNYYTYHIDNILFVRNFFDLYWVDFKKNEFGKINAKKNEATKLKWLGLYNTKEPYQDVQFNLGNTCYLIKLDPDLNTSYTTFTLSKQDINLSNKDFIYKTHNLLISFYLFTVIPFFTPNVLLLILIAFFVFFILYRQRKKRVPKEVNAILNYNFVNSLTVVEKELIQALYQHHLKGEEIVPKLINKIIGVQQKDTLTQNKSRSDHFLKINEKYKLATQQSLPLIVKSRDSIDKRVYNYGIETRYVQALEKYFKS